MFQSQAHAAVSEMDSPIAKRKTRRARKLRAKPKSMVAIAPPVMPRMMVLLRPQVSLSTEAGYSPTSTAHEYADSIQPA